MLFSQKVELQVGKEKVVFTVKHNLEELGLSLENAAVNWAARVTNRKDVTVKNFCKYVYSKDAQIICKPC